jgi:hypothetical protein
MPNLFILVKINSCRRSQIANLKLGELPSDIGWLVGSLAPGCVVAATQAVVRYVGLVTGAGRAGAGRARQRGTAGL